MCNVVYHFKWGWPLRQFIGPITSIPRFSSYRGRCEGQKDQLQLASQTHQIGDEDPRNLTESSKDVGKNLMISNDSVLICFEDVGYHQKFDDFLYVRIYNDYIYMYLFPFLKVGGGFLNLIVPMAAIGNGHHIVHQDCSLRAQCFWKHAAGRGHRVCVSMTPESRDSNSPNAVIILSIFVNLV